MYVCVLNVYFFRLQRHIHVCEIIKKRTNTEYLMLGFHDGYFAVSEFVQCFRLNIINHFTNFILPETMDGWMVRFTHTILHTKHELWRSVNNSVYLKICQKAKQSKAKRNNSFLCFECFLSFLIWYTVWFGSVPLFVFVFKLFFHTYAFHQKWSICHK